MKSSPWMWCAWRSEKQMPVKERKAQMLTITDEAKVELKNVLEQNPGKSLRVVMAGFG